MNKTKKLLSVLLAALMLTVICPCFSITAFADSAEHVLFTTCDGDTISTGQTDATIVLFGRPTCTNTRATLKSIAASEWVGSDKINVIFADVDSDDAATVKAFADEINCPEIAFCYDTSGKNNKKMWSYVESDDTVILPVTVYFDSENNAIKVTSGGRTAERIYGDIQSFFETGSIPPEPKYTIIETNPDEITPYNCIEYLERINYDIEGFRKAVSDGVSQRKEDIEIPSCDVASYSKASRAIGDYAWYYLSDYVCFLSSNYTYLSKNKTYLRCVYKEEYNSPEKLQSAHNKIVAVAEKLLQNIKGNESLTDVEKALLVHDRLAAHIDYDKGYYSDNIDPLSYYLYGALVNRKAVCNGYALSYSYLMNMLGIKTLYVNSERLNHAWNVTYINNKPYYVDVTWDDYTYALDGFVNHNNFLRSFEGLLETNHIPDSKEIDYPVSINGTEINDTTYDNYYWQNSYAEFRLVDDTIYYINNTEGTLNKADENHTVLYTIPDKWSSSRNNVGKDVFPSGSMMTDRSYSAASAPVEHSYSYKNCSRLSSLDKTLLFSGTDKVYKYDITTGKVSTVFIPNKTLYENIEDYYSMFGFKYEEEYLYCYFYYDTSCLEDKNDYLIKQKYTGEAIPQKRYSVTVTVDDSMGTVTGGGTYTEGSYVTLKAQNKPGYVFNGFYINDTPILVNENKTEAEITVNSDITVTARFDKCEHSNMISSVIPASCFENGYTQYDCLDCGHSYRADETPAYGSHNYKGGVCARCGERHPDYLESDHPYKNNSNETQIIYKKGADHIAITFSDDTCVEKDFDYIIVSDGKDNEIGKFTDKELAGKRIAITGDTVKITLTSDDSSAAYGYKLSDVEVIYETCTHTDTLTEIRGIKKATCSEKGYTGDVYCLECGRIAKKGEELPLDAENHTNMHEWTYESNCTFEGYTLHYCFDCNFEYKTNIVPINGKHTFQNGFCTNCMEIDKSYTFPELTGSCNKELTLEGNENYFLLFKPNQNGTIRFTVSEPENIDYYAFSGDYIVALPTENNKYATCEVEEGEIYYLNIFNQKNKDKTFTLEFEFIPDKPSVIYPTDPTPTDSTPTDTTPTDSDPTDPTDPTPTEPVPTELDKTDISKWDVSGIKNMTFTGKVLKQKNILVSNDSEYADFTVKYKNNVNAGTATVTITGIGNYTGTIVKTFKITKAANTVKVTAKTSVNASAKKKTTVKKVVTVKNAQGKVIYTTNNKKVTVKNGAIIVAKGLKKGKTYKVKITVTAKGNGNYKSKKIVKSIKIKVK